MTHKTGILRNVKFCLERESENLKSLLCVYYNVSIDRSVYSFIVSRLFAFLIFCILHAEYGVYKVGAKLLLLICVND